MVACGGCGRAVPDGGQWTTWCEVCDWNVVSRVDRSTPGLVVRWRRRMARRVGERVYADLLAGRGAGARDALAHATLLTVCWLIHLVTVAVVVLLGFAVLAPSWGGWRWAVALACLMWLYLVLPRPLALPRDGVVVSREDAPRLWSLVDEVASAVGTAPPVVLALSTDLNAYVMRTGWRWRRTLVLGLPLWAVEEPQERVALLGHELGHFKGRDVGRGFLVGLATHAVWRLVQVLWPDQLEEQPLDHDYTWLMLLTNEIRRLLALPPLGLLYVLDRLRVRSSQRAEYLADLAAARAAGPEAAQREYLRLLSLLGTETRARSAVRRREDVWTALAAAPRPSERELRRLRRESELTGHQVDDTHPPTHLRALLVAAVDVRTPTVVVDAARAQAIEAELQPVRERLREALTDSLLE